MNKKNAKKKKSIEKKKTDKKKTLRANEAPKRAAHGSQRFETQPEKREMRIPIIVPKYSREKEIDSEHPYCSLPHHYFEAMLARSQNENPGRNLFSIETWEGRKVVSVETFEP